MRKKLIRHRLIGLAAAILGLLVPTVPAQAEWMRAESANFIVYGESSQERLRRRVLLLEDFDRLLRALTNTQAPPAPNKLHVYLFSNGHALRQVRDLGSDVAGFYSATPHGVAVFVDMSAANEVTEGRNEFLLHEYAHHFMMQHYASAAFPIWYIEGFAEYVMTARFDDEFIEIGRPSPFRIFSIADRSNWMPLENIVFRNASYMDSAEAALFYAQSWALAHYLFRTETRRPQLASYLAALARTEDPPSAFRAAFGADPNTLGREVDRYVARDATFTRYRRTSVAAPPTITIHPIDASDAVVQIHAALRLGVAPRNRLQVLERARRAASGRNGAFTRKVLAHAEALYGDAATGERMLTALLGEAPGDAELLYLMGVRHMRAGREDPGAQADSFRAAQSWFVRAHRADGNHWQTLLRFAESMRNSPAYVSENTSNVLMLAHNLAPQVHEIALAAARMLIRRGAHEQAAQMLTPMLANPHAPETVAAAKILLERARARSSEGLPSMDEPTEELAEPSTAHRLPSPDASG